MKKGFQEQDEGKCKRSSKISLAQRKAFLTAFAQDQLSIKKVLVD